MSRYTMDVYVLTPGSELRKECDDLTEELKAWLVEKLREGKRPVPLRRALMDMADFAAGDTPEAHALISASRPHQPAIALDKLPVIEAPEDDELDQTGPIVRL